MFDLHALLTVEIQSTDVLWMLPLFFGLRDVSHIPNLYMLLSSFMGPPTSTLTTEIH
jgi:hypothetical protein